MDKAPQVRLHSTSHYFLEGLNEIGIDYVFGNLGTDHAPLIEEMARWKKQGLKHPPTILCPHENVAVHMALGYTQVTGRGQAILAHVDAGTANSSMALHNLSRARVPTLLMAGRAPFTMRGELSGARDTHVHFIQEPFDQAALVRPYVKWEYTLYAGVVAKEVLRRAHSVMHSDPMGPVYLTLPREVLAQSWDESAVKSFPDARYGAVRARGLDAATIGEMATRLLAARHPILITRYGGRNPAFAAVVDELARFAGIRVYESGALNLNISSESPCFCGISAAAALPKTDVGMLVDVDVPWIPAETKENAATFWIQIDVDAIKDRMPMWGFPTNLRVQADSTIVLGQLLEALRSKAEAKFLNEAKNRLDEIRSERETRAASLAKLAAERGKPGAIGVNYLCAELGRAIPADAIVFNEGIRNTPTLFNQLKRTKPGSIFGLPGGALGFSGAGALGAKLARREALAVQICGDGSFYQGTPETVYAVAKHYDLPILTVVIDNGGWSAVKEATLRMYPQGEAHAAGEYEARLAPEIDFAKIVESAGGYGAKVSDPDEVPDAIRRCLDEVRRGRSALLHACVTPL
ncbi:MAG TPA: thiamine pyrophosphate-requiring protein [Burkholderiales bacterium]|nr:thiamine pyrophosphate-requiring protein [Burkholderiales bacterium]